MTDSIFYIIYQMRIYEEQMCRCRCVLSWAVWNPVEMSSLLKTEAATQGAHYARILEHKE